MFAVIQKNFRLKLGYTNLLLFLFFSVVLYAQENIQGNVVDIDLYPLDGVTVSLGNKQTITNGKGDFILENNGAEFIEFSKDGYVSYRTEVSSVIEENLKIILTLDYESEKVLKPIIFTNEKKDISELTISGKLTEVLPTISGGVQDALKSLPSVNSNSELSSQLMVRGGNYDENLIYLNGIEIYTPLLVRSGRQEGMSIINPSMVQMLSFSPGGFEASYGDRMSSVLDIYYKRPNKNFIQGEASLINGSLTLGLTDKLNRFSALIGARYRDTNLILNTLDEDTEFNPRYFDFQSYLSYKISPKMDVRFLATYASNDFEMIPKSRETTFGTLFQPIQLLVNYRGQEKDKFLTENFSLQFNYQPIKKLKFQVSPYYYHSTEEEYFTISGSYTLLELDSGGTPTGAFNGGAQLNNARNDLDLAVGGIKFRTDFIANVNRTISAGFRIQQEDIKDRQREWQLVDSVGYSIPTPIFPPGNINDSPLNLNYYVNSNINLNTTRTNGFVQWVEKMEWGKSRVLFNVGLRGTYWDYNDEFDISPRAQFSIKPDWKKDMTFRLMGGVYVQPPFYKEIRRLDGSLNPDIQSQKSYQIILGNDYILKVWKRPFKLTTEVYYKAIKDLIPYYVDNVRIKYTGENNATGKVYGIESRLNGDFVPGVESWVSVAYSRAYQNINKQGQIPLPTDPRFKFSMFFQDEMKFWPSMKAGINFIYASGLPNGAPLFTDPYQYQSTLSAYRRVDISLTNVFIDEEQFKAKKKFWKNFNYLSLSLDIFNVFNISNTVSNQWVRDINTGVSYAVPNRLTGRFFNLKLRFGL